MKMLISYFQGLEIKSEKVDVNHFQVHVHVHYVCTYINMSFFVYTNY